MKNKKIFITPLIKSINFDSQDVIATSGEGFNLDLPGDRGVDYDDL